MTDNHQLTVAVNDYDIATGIRGDCKRCPVAKAVLRAMYEDGIDVYDVRVYGVNIVLEGASEHPADDSAIHNCEAPREVGNFVREFDSDPSLCIKLETPLPFTLTFPKSLITHRRNGDSEA